MRSKAVLMFVNPLFVLADIGSRRNFMPSWWMACIMFLLKRRFVPSSLCSIESSRVLGFVAQLVIVSISFSGSRSHFESR